MRFSFSASRSSACILRSRIWFFGLLQLIFGRRRLHLHVVHTGQRGRRAVNAGGVHWECIPGKFLILEGVAVLQIILDNNRRRSTREACRGGRFGGWRWSGPTWLIEFREAGVVGR